MLNYECKIENKSDVLRELTISVQPETIKAAIEEEFESVQKRANLKGFRQGKAPMTLIRQRFADDVKASTLNRLIRMSYEKALEENDLYPIGNPEFESKSGAGLTETEKLTFVAKIEVMPEIKIKDLSKIKLKKASDKLEDKEVTDAIKRLQESQAEIRSNPEENGPVKSGDLVEISFVGTIDGNALPELQASNRLAEIGAGHFMKEFEDNLIGLKKGESKEFPLSFDDQVPNENLKNKTAQMKVEVIEFKTKSLPELDDEFAKRFQKESLKELQSDIQQRIAEDKKEEVETNLREDLFKELIEMHKFDVPKQLVFSQLSYLMKQQKERFGRDLQNSPQSAEQIGQLMTLAEKQVRVFLILRQISKESKIEVASKDLEHEYTQIAQKAKMDVQAVLNIYENDNEAKQQLKAKLLEDRTIEHILSLASVKNS